MRFALAVESRLVPSVDRRARAQRAGRAAAKTGDRASGPTGAVSAAHDHRRGRLACSGPLQRQWVVLVQAVGAATVVRRPAAAGTVKAPVWATAARAAAAMAALVPVAAAMVLLVRAAGIAPLAGVVVWLGTRWAAVMTMMPMTTRWQCWRCSGWCLCRQRPGWRHGWQHGAPVNGAVGHGEVVGRV